MTPRTTATGEADGKRGSISALSNGIIILQAMSDSQHLRGVTDLAEETGMHKSTVSRILATLEEFQLVEKDVESRRFRLGVGVVALAGPMLARIDLRKLGRDVIQDITASTKESAALVLWTGKDGMVVEHSPSPHLVKHITPVGTRIDRLQSASMKVFLAAHMNDDGAPTQFLRQYSEFPTELEEELRAVREQGFGLNDGETDAEEWSVASPVFDYDGSCVGAVLISAPRSRITDTARRDIPQRAKAAGEKITRRMGLSN